MNAEGRRKILLTANSGEGHFLRRLPLLNRLRDEGYEVVLVTPPDEYVSKLVDKGYPWAEWRLRRGSLSPLSEFRALIDLGRIYRREAPDAVHHFTIKPIVYGTASALALGIPAVFNTFTGVGFPFLDNLASRLCRPFLQPLLRLLLRRQRVTTIFHNEKDRRILIERRVVSSRRAPVTYGVGVDVRTYRPPDERPEAVEPVILMASRLLWDKGVGEYVEAAQLLAGRGVRARFLFAGDRDPGSRLCIPPAVIREWAAMSPVQFIGHRSDMPDLLRRVDVAILPSYHEGLPRFLLEAAASGLPLVASDVSGCLSVVEDGVNGLVVPARDSYTLASAIETLARDAALRNRMGRASRALVLERFSEEVVVPAHLRVYEEGGLPRPPARAGA